MNIFACCEICQKLIQQTRISNLVGSNMQAKMVLLIVSFLFMQKAVKADYINSLANRLILPATQVFQEEVDVDTLKKQLNIVDVDVDVDVFINEVRASNNGLIETVNIVPKFYNKNKNKKIIVVFNPNGGTWQKNLYQLLTWANELNQIVVSFNYRGVGRSSPTAESSQDLISDGIAVVNNLNLNRMNASRVILYGHSIGGAIATDVAWFFHKRDLKVKLFVDRSFKSLRKASSDVFDQISKELYLQDKFILKMISFIPLGCCANMAIYLADWDLVPYKNFDKIEDKYKYSIYIRNDEMFSFENNLSSTTSDANRQEFVGSHNDFLENLKSVTHSEISGKDFLYEFINNDQ